MIILIVLDGLRSDQISEEHTPNIVRLSQSGVCFTHHHAVFPTETRVNVASMVTGCYPSRHGMVGNQFYLVSNGTFQRINTSNYQILKSLYDSTEGNVLHVPSLGELVEQAGFTMASINIGTSGNAYLNNHTASLTGGLLIHPQFTLPSKLNDEVSTLFGPWPAAQTPNKARMKHATTILLEHVIPRYHPDIVTFWLSEPDHSQHDTGISSQESHESIQYADMIIGRILQYLEEEGMSQSTDILVTSDHGQSTVTHTIDVNRELVDADLKENLESTEILVIGTGGSIQIWFPQRNYSKIQSLTNFLLLQDWCGSLFTASDLSIPGSFPLSFIQSQNPRSPDILLSFHWDKTHNINEIPGGGTFSTSGVAPRKGSHGSISPYEINNILVAKGPHFKRAIISDLPSGNIDLCPTLLHILRVTNVNAMDGRVLYEALTEDTLYHHPAQTYVHHKSLRIGDEAFQQKIQLSKVDRTTYLDKGWVQREKR